MKRMKRTLVALALVAAGAFIAAPAMADKDDKDDKKVSICHFPPGNPDNVHIITVSKNAFPGPHAKHGDFKASNESQCRGDDDDDDDDDNGDDDGDDNGDKNGDGDADSSSNDGTLASTGA